MSELAAIQSRAQEALEDLPQAGAIGLAALLGAARAYHQLSGLTPETLPGERETFLAAAQELEQLERLVESHPGALSQAFGRLVTVVGAAAARLERLEGGA